MAVHPMRPLALALAATSLTAPALGAELSLQLELPRHDVAEYHRPYLAAWIERPDQEAVGTLAVWYDTRLRNQRGQDWLKDLRQWWRQGGKAMALPADGVSGATRAPGRHTLRFGADHAALVGLASGNYVLAVETARESGGRELLRIPFRWPAAAVPGAVQATAQGQSELGVVTLTIAP